MGVVVAVIGIGSLWVYNGDGFIVVEVATIWWKVLCVFARERDKKEKRSERWKSRERN